MKDTLPIFFYTLHAAGGGTVYRCTYEDRADTIERAAYLENDSARMTADGFATADYLAEISEYNEIAADGIAGGLHVIDLEPLS